MVLSDRPAARKRKGSVQLDDDKTQSAIRFIVQLDQALDFKDDKIHEMATVRAGRLVRTKASDPMAVFLRSGPASKLSPSRDSGNGVDGTYAADRRASYPDSWPRSISGAPKLLVSVHPERQSGTGCDRNVVPRSRSLSGRAISSGSTSCRRFLVARADARSSASLGTAIQLRDAADLGAKIRTTRNYRRGISGRHRNVD